jgi:KDO2-lipid IV(A) lauroyltransferase
VAFSSFYRPAENKQIDAMIRDLRRQAARADIQMFPKGAMGARQSLMHLSRGGRLGMLMDQKMNDGIEARFFGRPAMTAPALAALALRLRCPVIPGYVERLGPARFRVTCEPPLALPDSGDRVADIADLTQTVNDTLERWIRTKPESWLWLHRRWPAASI